MDVDVVGVVSAAESLSDVRGHAGEVIDVPAVLGGLSAGLGVGPDPFRHDEFARRRCCGLSFQGEAAFRDANQNVSMEPVGIGPFVDGERRQSDDLLAGIMGAKKLGVDLVQDLTDLCGQGEWR